MIRDVLGCLWIYLKIGLFLTRYCVLVMCIVSAPFILDAILKEVAWENIPLVWLISSALVAWLIAMVCISKAINCGGQYDK